MISHGFTRMDTDTKEFIEPHQSSFPQSVSGNPWFDKLMVRQAHHDKLVTLSPSKGTQLVVRQAHHDKLVTLSLSKGRPVAKLS